MVYITGDTHGDFRRFTVRNFPEQLEMNGKDVVIILGDFGGIWKDSPAEREDLKWLSERPFTTMFIDGNHENFDRLLSGQSLVFYDIREENKECEFPIIFDFSSCKQLSSDTKLFGYARMIYGSKILHIGRGSALSIDSNLFFCFGGAQSHDIKLGILDRDDYSSDEAFRNDVEMANRLNLQCRVNHESWWKEELSSQHDRYFGDATIDTYGKNGFDYILTHCCPSSIQPMIVPNSQPDVNTSYFQKLLDNGLKFKRWYFGHYHLDERINDKFEVCYRKIQRIV